MSEPELDVLGLHEAREPDCRADQTAVRVAGVFAIEDSCTHAYFPMSDGDVVGDCEIECALHGAKFDLRDGSVLSAPATDALKTYRVMEQDGGIWVGEQLGGSGE